MKITILSPAYPFRGGIANFTNILANELFKYNDVEIVTFKRQYPKVFFPGKTQLESSENPLLVKSVRLLDSINPINWFTVGKKIKLQKPDVLIFSFWMPFFAPAFGTIAKIVKKNNHTKILSVCHNVIPHETKPGDIFLTKYFFSKVDYFILLSKKVKNDLLNLLPDANYKILFHPAYSSFGKPVDKETAKRNLGITNENIILFFGLIREYKGLDVLLEAMAEVKEKLKVKLIVAGEFYENKDKYLKLIEKYKLNKFVDIIDKYIEPANVKYYFSAADAVILPYKDATQSGIVQLAINFGKPIIGTNVGGLGEIIENGKNGYIVEPDNPKKLSESIIKFYKENKEFDFSENIKITAGKFSWEKFIFELINFVKI